jgi:hypothetical protein
VTINSWHRKHLVNLLGVLALLLVAATWVLDVFYDLVPIGHTPVIYDLALAYLTGWVFHLLVVVIPERHRTRQLLDTLRGSLMMIANNGRDLVRDLEFIGQCPERPVTMDHLEKVCRTIGNGAGTHSFLILRLSVARESFLTVEPHFSLLPTELVSALQRVDQVFMHQRLGVPRNIPQDRGSRLSQPEEMRNEGVAWHPSETGQIPKRWTLNGSAEMFYEYYKLTEAVRAAMPKWFIETRPVPPVPERVDMWSMHKANEKAYPFVDYPSTAFSDDWVGPLPNPPKNEWK